MTKLDQLYNSIENLKELGVQLPDKLIEETNRVEEEIIQKEVIPRLSESIDPIINQIQRELLLVIEYVPNEPLQVKMTRKRSFKMTQSEEKQALKSKSFKKHTSYTISPHSKARKTNLVVKFPDGQIVDNHFASKTLCQVIELIGPERVESLGIINAGIPLVSKEEDDFYIQHSVKGGYLISTHSSTIAKKHQVTEISDRLGLNLEVGIQEYP